MVCFGFFNCFFFTATIKITNNKKTEGYVPFFASADFLLTTESDSEIFYT